MQVNDLLGFLKDEGLIGYVNVVNEPEYSKQKLINFQKEYKISSDTFYDLYVAGYLNNLMPNHIIDEWAYNYEIFLKSNGDIDELVVKKTEDGDSFPSSSLFH